jgi:hypothetical protein
MSGHSVQYYLELLDDRPRIDAYVRAIRRVVRPGDVVLDLGSGVGLFAVLAARHGARQVLAVEREPAGRLALELARANGVADRVRLIEGWSTTLAAPERADVCIFDDFDLLQVRGATAAILEDAVTRWLRPQARLIPSTLEIWGAPVSMPGVGARYRPRAPVDGALTVDLAALRDLGSRMPWSVRASSRGLVASPQRFASLPMRDLGSAPTDTRRTSRALRAGRVDGLLVWLRVHLAAGVAFDAGPGSRSTAYWQVLLPLSSPLAVRRGQRLACTLRCAAPRARQGRHVFWEWTVAAPSGRSGGDTFSTCQLPPRAALIGDAAMQGAHPWAQPRRVARAGKLL